MRLRKTILMTIAAMATASSTQAAKICQACPPGTYSSADTNNQCKPCAVGTYQNEMGQSSCKPCDAGTYQNQIGQVSCIACPAGQYQDSIGQANCKVCDTIVTTGKTYCPSATNTTDWSCRTSTLGSANQNSGYFGEAYKINSGQYCHCRRTDQTGAWSSWVYNYVNDYNHDGCSAACAAWCSIFVSTWGGGARW
jgi:hypothetical protein